MCSIKLLVPIIHTSNRLIDAVTVTVLTFDVLSIMVINCCNSLENHPTNIRVNSYLWLICLVYNQPQLLCLRPHFYGCYRVVMGSLTIKQEYNNKVIKKQQLIKIPRVYTALYWNEPTCFYVAIQHVFMWQLIHNIIPK